MANNTYLLFEASSLVCRCRWVSFLTLLVTFFGFHVSFRELQKKKDFKVRPDYHKRLKTFENISLDSFFRYPKILFAVDIQTSSRSLPGYLDLTSWIFLMQKVSDGRS